MSKPGISAAIATYNEAENIEPCLTSLKQFASEIVIVDGSSTDNTVEIARKHGAKVITVANKPMFHINKNLAISNCSQPWIFLIDADERVSADLATEITGIVKAGPAHNGYWVNRRNWFLGGYLKKGGAYPDSVLRLFKKGKGRLPEVSVHEQVAVDGTTGQLKCDLLHLADPNFARYLSRANRYTTQTALGIKAKNPGTNVFSVSTYLVFYPIWTFCKLYIRHKGYEDGFRGFVWALFSGYHYFYAYVKYWQGEQNLSKK